MAVNKKNRIISNLEEFLNGERKVLIFNHSDKTLFGIIRKSIEKRSPKNIEIWHCMDDTSEDIFFKHISFEEMEEILNLYRMYEFSDKITVLSEDIQYANMINYVKAGLLTPEEMVEALLIN